METRAQQDLDKTLEVQGGYHARITWAILLTKADNDNDKVYKLVSEAAYVGSKHWLEALEVSLGRDWAEWLDEAIVTSPGSGWHRQHNGMLQKD